MSHRNVCFPLFVFLSAICAAAFGQAQDKPLPGKLAAEQMALPPGFKATLFASEPDVVQPISFTFDDRGRLWVVESYAYPGWAKKTKDRVIILEDTDGDGHFDKRTVFWDQGVNLTSIELGFGGVWLCSLPNLIFVPDRDGDDVPDGPAEILLDGWSMDGKHNAVNSLAWGPDGWLYGCQGILSNSRIGKPGTPDDQRTPMNCGVWRFHPTRHEFEVVAHGTTNPWGLDFDAVGEAFITNCVIHHLWHVVPGAHFQRMFGQDFNPHLYGLMASCADHLHWAGGPWFESKGNQAKHSDAGGGHAHVGAMIYLGDNWPDEYRGHLFTCNLHGLRVNQDILVPHGSGYVAHHGTDFLKVKDPWFRGLKIQYGPDGGVYVSDWSDTGECHNYDVVNQETGRIYKITYGTPKHPTLGTPKQKILNLAELTDFELAELNRTGNEWYWRHARRLLQERTIAGHDMSAVHTALRGVLANQKDVHNDATRQLRALWGLYATGGMDESRLLEVLRDPNEHLRAWAIRLLSDSPLNKKALDRFAIMAAGELSAKVRLSLASAMRRTPIDQRLPILSGLVTHGEDSADDNLPLMIWYALELVAASDPESVLPLFQRAEIPLVREFLARRIANLAQTEAKTSSAEANSRLNLLVGALGFEIEPAAKLDILRGMHAALEGRSHLKMPQDWPKLSQTIKTSDNPKLAAEALYLGLIFGDASDAAELGTIAQNKMTDRAERCRAIEALTQVRDTKFEPTLIGLLDDPAVRSAALRGLAAYEDDAIPPAILLLYSKFTPDEKQAAIGTLVSRPRYARTLLGYVGERKIPAADISIYNVRQLRELQVPEITAKLEEVWGTTRTTPDEKLKLIRKYRGELEPGALAKADRPHGRAVFARVCAACHKLFGEGADIGPDLTGSQRSNLDYVLQNVVDPSAIVGRDYRMTLITTDDGRVITGIIKRETESSLSVQTPTQLIVLAKADIAERKQSMISMMPEALLENLKADEVRDLVGYLASPMQVPLPPQNASLGQGK